MKWLLAALACLMLFAPARAEQDIEKIVDSVDLGPLIEAAEDTEIDIRGMILSMASGDSAWDIDHLLAEGKRLLLQEFSRAAKMVAGLLAPALLSALVRQLSGEGRGASVVSHIAYLVCASQLTVWFLTLIRDAGVLIARIASLSDAVFPVLAAFLSLSGAMSTAALVTPLSALMGNAFSALLSGVGLKLCAVAAALAVAGNLNPRLRLDRLFDLVKSVVNWATGVLMTGFLGLSAVKALLGSSYDSAAVRTARYAVDNLLPVIGGEVANTLDALVSSVLLVKNAAGATGLSVLVALCAQPLMGLTSALFALRLVSAMLEPVAEDALLSLSDKFSQVAGMLLVVCASGAVILTLLLGGLLTAGQGMVR
jgi:stage III sporulation protein AE